jgi:uncharacterized repeat protein (TIGR01451 family)
VNLLNASNASIRDAQGVGLIAENETRPNVADVQVTQTDSADPIVSDAALTYTLMVRNSGPDAAQKVVLTDVLPAGAIFVTSNPAPTSRNGAQLKFDLGDLDVNTSRTVTIQLKTGAAGSVTHRASVTSNTPDAQTGNNTDGETTQIVGGAATFAVTLGAMQRVGPYVPGLFGGGNRFTQTATVRNTGSAAAQGPLALMLKNLPSGVEVVGANSRIAGVPFLNLPLGLDGILAPGEEAAH